jgi:cellulose synthase/poly-beta-1,6-N-acetylglucosamine synthase-like glycosyltransferase
MSNQNLRLIAPRPATAYKRPRLPLGRFLVDNDAIRPDQLLQALQMQQHIGAPIGEILVSEGWADLDDIQTALAAQHGVNRADLPGQPPDPALCLARPGQFWLRHRVIPWMRLGQTILVATSRPDQFDKVRAELGGCFPDVIPVLASEPQIAAAIAELFALPLAQAAGTRVAAQFSCRMWKRRRRGALAFALPVLLTPFFLAPALSLGILGLIAIFSLAMFAALKLSGFVAHLIAHDYLTAPDRPRTPPDPKYPLPRVSVLVPLFHEKEIAGALIRRLGQLTYPKALLDVLLVLEEHDDITHATLGQTELPPWMRVIEVPAHGGLTTKPRAMNYALDFCRGDIVGVWDAEDAPAADQIEHVVARFAQAPDDVVCLQGILDYYNPRTNWLARCFTIEYASWFRIILPGIARLGLVVPLGGTTLFFKRAALEELGGWDAHNVTEDADLGVRLCRAGYRTELIDTVTFEEANCRPWPWIKQRSRWLKGFMVTYLVHMRRPRQLLADLGLWRFWGVQAFFIGTLSQFLLAPVLWSFWLILLGLPHPAQSLLPAQVLPALAAFFILSEALAICIGLVAVSTQARRNLIWYVPTMMFYFPLGVIAAYKALYELIFHPYYWDKTQHGLAAAEIQHEQPQP